MRISEFLAPLAIPPLLALAGCGVLGTITGAHQARPAAPVDHVVLGVSDLEAGIRKLEAWTGVRPAEAGAVGETGTQNAFLSLGRGQFLEVIAPLPGARVPDRLAPLLQHDEPTPVQWGLTTDDITRTQRLLRMHGYETSGPTPGSRARADGAVLRWKTLHITEPHINAAPFFIEWDADSAHPAASAPAGCALSSLQILVPNPSRLRRLLSALGHDIEVKLGKPTGPALVLDTPKGPVQIGGSRTASPWGEDAPEGVAPGGRPRRFPP